MRTIVALPPNAPPSEAFSMIGGLMYYVAASITVLLGGIVALAG